MIELIAFLKEHFDPLTDHLEIFAQQGTQVEGWFKGELILALSRLHSEGHISDFDREAKIDRGRVDFTITVGDQIHLVELKHWLIGMQKGTNYYPKSYFSDATSVGVLPDVKKLSESRYPGSKWVLILLTANPGNALWAIGVSSFNSKFQPLHLTSVTSPSDFPPVYCLGLLNVSELPAI